MKKERGRVSNKADLGKQEKENRNTERDMCLSYIIDRWKHKTYVDTERKTDSKRS